MEFDRLPKGKAFGICEPEGGSTEGGSSVDILGTCSCCNVGKCMMFEEIDLDGNKVKRFIKHEPKY